MADIKGQFLYVNLSASQVRRLLKGFGHGARKIQSAGKDRAVVIHTATGQHREELEAVFSDVKLSSPEEGLREELGSFVLYMATGEPTLSELLLGNLCRRFLLRAVKEDCRPILASDIRALTVRLRGIVVLPKNSQKLFVCYFGRIVLHLHRFGMAGVVGTDTFIGRVRKRPTGISDRCR